MAGTMAERAAAYWATVAEAGRPGPLAAVLDRITAGPMAERAAAYWAALEANVWPGQFASVAELERFRVVKWLTGRAADSAGVVDKCRPCGDLVAVAELHPECRTCSGCQLTEAETDLAYRLGGGE